MMRSGGGSQNKRTMNKKIVTIGLLVVCIFLVAAYLSHTDLEREGGVSEPVVPATKEPAPDSGVTEDEWDYDNDIEIEIDPGDFHQYWTKAFDTYHSLLGERLEEHEEVRFSGYVADASRDRYSVYTIVDSQSSNNDSNYIDVGCWVGEEEYPERGYAIGDYITVQGSLDYFFSEGKITIDCSLIEKEGGKRVKAYDYHKNKPYINMTISEIHNDFSAGIAALETVLPRDRLIKSSGYYVEGPSADFGTTVMLLKNKVEDWDQPFPFQVSDGYDCLSTNYSLIEDIKNGEYVTWWVYFGENWHHKNNCIVAKIQKTPPPN